MERNWKRLVKIRNDSIKTSSSNSTRTFIFEPFGPAVKKAIRQGIPSNLRPMAWYFYSGGEALKARHPNPGAFYESLLLQPKPSAFFLLTDRIKMDFRDILPTNELVRRDYFSASNTMINDIPDVGRVRIIPDRSESPNDLRPRRMTIFDRDPKIENVPEMINSVIPSTATPFMSRLYNVLVAFFMFRPRVEYCRAVCSLASILLLVIQDEEMTFWTISALFSNYASNEESFESTTGEDLIMFHDYRNDSEATFKTENSNSSTTGSLAETSTGFKYFPEEMFKDISTCSYASLDGFKKVLKKKRASLVEQLDNFDIPVSLLTTTWFQSLFVDVLPTESSMRVLDAFIGEGFKILYRVSLALFFINEAELMQKMKPRSSNTSSITSNFFGSLMSRSNSPVGSDQIASPQAILNFIKFMPKKQVDADVLMDFAFNNIGSLPLSSILAECKKAADVEKPLQSIRRFSQTPETKLSMETIRRVSSAGR